jgi:hypothetical protein
VKTEVLRYSSGAGRNQARQWLNDGEEAATADIVGEFKTVIALAHRLVCKAQTGQAEWNDGWNAGQVLEEKDTTEKEREMFW